ncbi:MAG: hypothetical protein EP297_07980 [Gammaproteobacteria bacterium]|nr:MAG: hypothetical protein EP297_07980 [Gammaproteobacteria bacterium]
MIRYLKEMAYFLSLMLLTTGAFANTSEVKRYNFKVFLEDKEIGSHRFTVTLFGEKTYVKSEASFDVKILFISAYNYQHTSNEEWQGECLRSIFATTDDNGEERFVHGQYDKEHLLLSTSIGKRKLDGCIRTYAYWNPEYLRSQRLLNPQTGKLEPVNLELLGASLIDVRGETEQANRYRINNDKFKIDLWYSDQKEWLALESTTENGSRLRYQVQ